MSKVNNDNTTQLLYDDKLSYVARDRIWKNHIEKMEQAAKIWPENWGFLKGKLENLVIDDNKEVAKGHKNSLAEPEKVENFKSVPRTAAGWIGWKSTDELNRLEKYGPYTKGRGSILKKLNWPSEAIS